MSRVAARAMDAFRFFRCEFWVVSVFPAWVGWCLATRQIVPGADALQRSALALLALDPSGPGGLLDWAEAHWRALLALVTLGPFLGGAIMVTNDYFDRQVDAFNPKKAKSPLVRGTASPRAAKLWMSALCVATLVSGYLLDARFGALLALGLALSFAYSAPPVRLKSRPFGDILVNAVGYGAITTLAGWGLGSGWTGPWPLGGMLIVALAISAGYIPTVMMDRDTDARTGVRSTAVEYGQRVSWRLGLLALLGANATMIGLALAGVYVGPSFVLVVLAFLVLELLAYALLVADPDPQREFLGGSIVTLAFFGNLVAFLVAYTTAP